MAFMGWTVSRLMCLNAFVLVKAGGADTQEIASIWAPAFYWLRNALERKERKKMLKGGFSIRAVWTDVSQGNLHPNLKLKSNCLSLFGWEVHMVARAWWKGAAASGPHFK